MVDKEPFVVLFLEMLRALQAVEWRSSFANKNHELQTSIFRRNFEECTTVRVCRREVSRIMDAIALNSQHTCSIILLREEPAATHMDGGGNCFLLV